MSRNPTHYPLVDIVTLLVSTTGMAGFDSASGVGIGDKTTRQRSEARATLPVSSTSTRRGPDRSEKQRAHLESTPQLTKTDRPSKDGDLRLATRSTSRTRESPKSRSAYALHRPVSEEALQGQGISSFSDWTPRSCASQDFTSAVSLSLHTNPDRVTRAFRSSARLRRPGLRSPRDAEW